MSSETETKLNFDQVELECAAAHNRRMGGTVRDILFRADLCQYCQAKLIQAVARLMASGSQVTGHKDLAAMFTTSGSGQQSLNSLVNGAIVDPEV